MPYAPSGSDRNRRKEEEEEESFYNVLQASNIQAHYNSTAISL
jgi:hypothetical protein